MIKKNLMILGIPLIAMIISGCSLFGYKLVPLEENWGVSFETARDNQILNPEAEKDLSPVEGLDGDAANRNQKEYYKSFDTDCKQSSVTNTSLKGITSSD